MFSAACLTSMETIHFDFESGMGKLKLNVAGSNARLRIGSDCFGRAPRAGEAGLTERAKPFASICTAGERERVKGMRSGTLVGLLRRELPECETDESLCALEGCAAASSAAAGAALFCRLALLSMAWCSSVRPRRTWGSSSVSSSLAVSESDLGRARTQSSRASGHGESDVRTLRTPPGSSCSNPAAVPGAALASLTRACAALAGDGASPHVLWHAWPREGRGTNERAAG